MKLKSITIENFRCYKEPITMNFAEFTTIIGQNDAGKSTILEALEVFFNNDVVKIEETDVNVHSSQKTIVISCDFCQLPNELVLDVDTKTTFEQEYLTIEKDTIRIKKIFDCSKVKIIPETYLVTNYPSNEGISDLITLKEKDLQSIIKAKGLDVKLKGKPSMRHAIFESYGERLILVQKDILLSKAKDDVLTLWNNIEESLPKYALFQSDRSTKDTDESIQNPMKYAIQTALADAKDEIDEIKMKVRTKALAIANSTHDVLKALDKDVADSLIPQFTDATQSKWNALFSVSMNTNDDIPLNKRGSGIRRLILISFFKAEADRMAAETQKSDIIYAIEEPETSMHPNYQTMVVHSLINLSQSEHCQICITTHNPNLAKELPLEGLRFVTRDSANKPIIESGEGCFEKIKTTLGVFPSIDGTKLQVVVCVEGPTDVIAIKSLNKILRDKYPTLVDFENDERITVIPLGGSILKYWVECEYLKNVKCKEVHIYDNDVAKYKETVDMINARKDGSWATLTSKYEIENYLHTDAIKKHYGVMIDTTQQNVPEKFGIEYSKVKKFDGSMKGQRAKIYLSRVFEEDMTIGMLEEIDPQGEVKGWFERISNMLVD